MILDFGSYIINEASLEKLKKDIHGVLNMSARKRMRKELRDNIITFKFRKRNGDLRTAHGTLHPDYLPPLKGGGPRPEKQMVYYDLDKEGWRSFRSYSFIKILNIKPVEGKPIGPKVTSKPTPKKEEEDEVKKTAVEREEEEVKKPIHAKEEEEKEVKKPISKKEDEDVDEDGEKHAYKSPIYDETKEEKKERLEDDEKIEKIKHKDEPEDKEKDREKDEEKKSEDE